MKGEMNLISLFIAGGWVMYPILFLSVIALTITMERLIVVFLQKLKLKPEKFLIMFEKTFQETSGDKAKTVEIMEQFISKKNGMVVEILSAALKKFKDGTAKKMGPMELKTWMKTSVEERANTELPALESHLGALAVIANVATLMGLFGTVMGMIESFTAMANSPGGVKADEMAGGIAVALVATAGGLVVAVPSLILFNLIKANIEGFVLQIEETTTDVIDKLSE